MNRFERICVRCGQPWRKHWRFEGVIAPPSVTKGPATLEAILAVACWVRSEQEARR
mgnify:CR=1 FL=1